MEESRARRRPHEAWNWRAALGRRLVTVAWKSR